VVTAAQRDPAATRRLLETLAFGQVEIESAAEPFQAEGKSYPASSHVIRARQPYGSFAKALLERQSYPDLRQYPGGPPKRPYDVTAHTLPLLMGVEVDTIDKPFEARLEPASSFHHLPKPVPAKIGELRKRRIALYRSFMPAMDEGWTRWLFDEMKIPHTPLKNPDILAGDLRTRFDTIVFASQGPAAINYGYRPGAMPVEITGGLGDAGARQLAEFAREGGTLIFLNDSSNFAVGHMGLPLRNVLRGIPSRDFYCPGALLNVTLDEAHPLSAGLPKEIPIWFDSSPAWEIPKDSSVGRAVARFGSSGLLASGWLLGERHLAGRAALMDVPIGKGRAVLFGMRPQYRAQSYLTMKLLFNALLL
jgi:hypothetical protein